MAGMESRGTVKRVIDRDGKTLVSFHEHSGYFVVPAALVATFRAAESDGQELAFRHDRDLNILELLGPDGTWPEPEFSPFPAPSAHRRP